MKGKIFTTSKSLAIALGFVMANGIALAQEPVNVTIEAQRSEIVGRNTLGGPIELVSISRHVSYSDLDLTQEVDVAMLEKRVHDAANALCNKLDRMHPFTFGADTNFFPSCVNKAKSAAMKQVQTAIAAAAERRDTTQPAG